MYASSVGGSMEKGRVQNHKGSITVEAAVIVPIVIIAVMVVLHIVLLIFQSCIMHIAANKISERAAAVWQKPNIAFETGKTTKSDIEELEIYRRWNFNNSADKRELQEYAIDMLRSASILKGEDIKVDILYQNTIITQKITVKLSASYTNPLGGLTGAWGLGGRTQLNVQSQSVVDDPVEFIRNSDFILETASKVPLISEFESKWNEIVNKIVEYVNNLNKGEKTN